MFSRLFPPTGYEGAQPNLAEEMRQWGEDGLIPKVHDSDIAEEVMANMLQVIRKHINEIYGHPLYVIDQRPIKGHIAEFVALCKGVIRGDVTPRS